MLTVNGPRKTARHGCLALACALTAAGYEAAAKDEGPPAEETPAPVPPGQPSATSSPDDPGAEGCAEGAECGGESVFGWFTLSLQVGAAIFPEAGITVKGVRLTIERRAAFVGKLHLDLGGDGLGFEIAPLFAIEGSGKRLADLSVDTGQGLGGGLGGDFIAVGGQLALVYRFQAGGRFFPHLGLGFHGASLISDSIDYGVELYGRIPIGFSWYWGESFALTVDVGFMYGATGIRLAQTRPYEEMLTDIADEAGIDPGSLEDAPDDLNDPFYDQFSDEQRQTLMEAAIAEQARFGSGFGFDFSIGVRFP